jgi:MFS family permease
MITLGVYLIGSGLTAVTPNGGHWFIFLYATRIVAGMGIGIHPAARIGYLHLLTTLFRVYPGRSVLVAALMITQSFLYNAIFFTSSLVLEFYFHVKPANTSYYFFAFAAGNLLGPLTIGHLFDTIGRKKMISGTYITAGALLIVTAVLFKNGDLTATTQTICWAVVFFFASAGASAGYLTASEVFPLEVRAQSIAVFFAIAQCFGAFGTHWYWHLIGDGSDRNSLFLGYMVGAGAMILGGVAAIIFGVNAEGKPLEDVATPLSVIAKPPEATGPAATGPAATRAGSDPGRPGTVPDPRLGSYDDRAGTRDDGTPLA